MRSRQTAGETSASPDLAQQDRAQQSLTLDVRRQLGEFRLEMAAEIPARGVTAVFGVSGSGKTSLLRLIAGLDRPDVGHIRIEGEALVDTAQRLFVPPHRRRLGVVFQEARLFPHYRVRGNLAYGMRPAGRQRLDATIELLGLRPLLQRFPATLSGGEARRVAIGRALLTEPRMLLMDEPLTGLDGARKRELLHYIRRLVREIDIPVVYVSHDPAELTAIADHLVLVDQGRVLAAGPFDELLTRADLMPHFGGFGAASVITATVEEHDPEYALTRLRLTDGQQLTIPAVDEPAGASLRLRVPARDVALASSPPRGTSYRNHLRAVIDRVVDSAHDRAVAEVRLRVGPQLLHAWLTRKSCDELHLKAGMTVTAMIRTVAFDTRA